MTQNYDPNGLPHHVAIIMDGNGRWAERYGLPRTIGHYNGVNATRKLIEKTGNLGIKVLTLYAFSTENWGRSPEEVDYLMNLIVDSIDRELPDLQSNDIRLQFMGRRDGLPAFVLQVLDDATRITCVNASLILNLALNYGGRAEMIDAMKAILIDQQNGVLDPDGISEATFARYLYNPGTPDVDLLIRTGGECRFSNFLLWRATNAVFWSTPVLWPDFNDEHLMKAIEIYHEQINRTKN